MNWLTGFLCGLALALAISSRAETVYASVWTFSGDNTWTPSEWHQIFKSAQEFYEERLGIRLKIVSWKNRGRGTCKGLFRYAAEKKYGNCLIHKTNRKSGSFNLFLAPPIPANSTSSDTYVGGISTGICQPIGGTAMVYGKRISTHVFDDGGNAGWELTRLAVIHELGHLLGAHHPEDVGRMAPLNIMDTEALGYLVDEYQVKINGIYQPFRDVLPLVKFSKNEVRKCLKENQR